MRDEFPKNRLYPTQAQMESSAGERAQSGAADPGVYAAVGYAEGSQAGGYAPPSYYAPPYSYGNGYGYPPPVPQETQRAMRKFLRRSSNQISFALLSVFLVSNIVMYIVSWIVRFLGFAQLSLEMQDTVRELAKSISYVSAFLIPAFMLMKAVKVPRRFTLPTRAPRLLMLFCAVGVSMGAVLLGSMLSQIVSAVVYSLIGKVPTPPNQALPGGITATVLYIVNIAVFPPIIEELFFRGVVMQSLRRFGDTFALLVSSILFACAHGNLIQIPNALVMGLVIGYFVLRTNSLWTGIVLHMVNNGLSVAMQFLMQYTTSQQDLALNQIVVVFFFCFGIFGVILLRLCYGRIFCIKKGQFPLSWAGKLAAFFTAPATIIYVVAIAVLAAQNLQ